MAVSVALRINLSSDLGKIADGMDEKAALVIAKTALDLEGHAKVRAPVDTGFLRSSIRARKVSQHHWEVIVGAEYGVYVEYGTRYMAAQPYLNPAADAVRGPFIQAMKKVTQ